MSRKNLYSQLIESVFFKYYKSGDEGIEFQRAAIVSVATDLGIDPSLSIGALIYPFRRRTSHPNQFSAARDWTAKASAYEQRITSFDGRGA